MVNFIVLNETVYEVDNINVIYVDEQSMDDQHADADGVTVLSDGDIPNGTQVEEVNVDGIVITQGATRIPVGGGSEIAAATLIYFNNPKSGQSDIIGVEIQQDVEG